MGNLGCCCKNRDTQLKTALLNETEDSLLQFCEKYELGELLGTGSFGKVFEAIDKQSKAVYAVKCFDKERFVLEEQLEEIEREIALMKRLRHPHIVEFIDYFDGRDHIYLVLEQMKGGELFDRIEKKGHYHEGQVRDMMRILIDVMDYLHQQQIVHRDLKPQNLLMNATGDDLSFKVADFGLAVVVPSQGLTEFCGTLDFIAPEVIKRTSYGCPADMWSIGVIMFILLSGTFPFGDSMKELEGNILSGNYSFDTPYWEVVTPQAREVVLGLLQLDPSRRLSATEVLRHSWMSITETDIAQVNLDANLTQFKKYNARRKWKKVGNVVIASNKFKGTLK